jgi:hypothetical protein
LIVLKLLRTFMNVRERSFLEFVNGRYSIIWNFFKAPDVVTDDIIEFISNSLLININGTLDDTHCG